MKLLLLEKRREPETSQFPLLGVALGLDITVLDPALLGFEIGSMLWLPGTVEPAEAGFDALIIRSYHRFSVIRQLARAFRKRGKPVFGLNPEHPAFMQDKLCDLMDLADAGLPVPQTWGALVNSPKVTPVVKPNWGFGGLGVRLADVLESTDPHLEHVQAYLPGSLDWRVLLAEGRALPWLIERTPAAGDFRTNTHQGGALRVIPAPHDARWRPLAELAERAGAVLAGLALVLTCGRDPRAHAS